MKKSIFFLLLILASRVWGQDLTNIRKGNFLAGGSLSGHYENKQGVEFNHNYSLGFNSNAGYFFLSKFAAGLSVSANEDWNRNTKNDPWNRNSIFKVSPLLRYYVWSKLFVSFEPGCVFGNYNAARLDSKTKGFNLTQGLGYDLFIKENIALEIGYFYSYSRLNLKSVAEDQFPFTDELKTQKSLISIGIQVFL